MGRRGLEPDTGVPEKGGGKTTFRKLPRKIAVEEAEGGREGGRENQERMELQDREMGSAQPKALRTGVPWRQDSCPEASNLHGLSKACWLEKSVYSLSLWEGEGHWI